MEISQTLPEMGAPHGPALEGQIEAGAGVD